MKAAFLLLFLSCLYASTLENFAYNSGEVSRVVQNCVKHLTLEQMEQEIAASYSEVKGVGRTSYHRASLDGLKLNQISSAELADLEALTIHRDSNKFPRSTHYEVRRLNYLQQNSRKRRIEIKRSCSASFCVDQDQADFDLSKFNDDSPCSTAICAAKKIFGSPQGIYILYSYRKYGMNLSPYSDVNADPGGFDEVTLRAILAAAQLIPEHLRDKTLRDSGFYRFKKGHTLSMFLGGGVLANATGAVFDGLDEYDENKKMYVFLHELGHRAADSPGLFTKDMDDSSEWHKCIKWHQGAYRFFNEGGRGNGWVSEYAKNNPWEDFAETFALYRLNQGRLRSISKERHDFMKSNVFEGLDFEKNLCEGEKQSAKKSKWPKILSFGTK